MKRLIIEEIEREHSWTKLLHLRKAVRKNGQLVTICTPPNKHALILKDPDGSPSVQVLATILVEECCQLVLIDDEPERKEVKE